LALDPVETLQRLIQTPSVNPMGRDVAGPEYGESRMTDLLVGICEQHGWPYLRQPVHSGRDNLLVLVEGNPSPLDGGEVLLWDVHQDTVATDGMTVAPFGGEVLDGRVYGRGASDVKGSMAAMLAALSRVAEDAPTTRPTIVLACTANEECGFTGARAVVELWKERSESNIFSHAPHAAVVAEPTDFNVIVAHQGQARWRCHTVGRAAHTSRPDNGINAIYGMAQVIQAIERFHKELSSSGPEHPLCGRPSVCVSTIRGGVGINTVPERATIEIDRRLAPNVPPTAAYEQLIGYVAKNADVGRCRIEHDPPFMQSMGLSDQNNRPMAERLTGLIRQHGREGMVCGAPYGTDAAAISAAGVPTVVVGPGSIDQAHTADEYIAIEELKLGAEIFYDIACKGVSL
jgi:acetylornithine deacetylase/succinyl-diaminopimelate desuccinylase-like protein